MPENVVVEELTQMKKLIKINDQVKDFTADVTITSEDGRDFMFQFFSQSDLDSSKDIKYDLGNNISTSFRVEGKPYESYYILLKTDSDKPVRVKITVVLNEIKNGGNSQKKTVLDNNLGNGGGMGDMKDMTDRRLSNDESTKQDILDRPQSNNDPISSFVADYSLQIGLCFLVVMVIVIARTKI